MKRALLVSLGVAVLAGSDARTARACGGFFCNQPQPGSSVLPIAQAAENVLFVLDRDPATGAQRVEAHIQILYTGPASQFSWIVPVTSVPTVSTGSDILFDRIEPPTRPSFRVTYQMDGNCRGFSGVGAGCGSAASGGADESGGFGAPSDAGVPAVDVLARGSTGPFEYVVIRSEDGATLRTWLTTNGYYVSPDAAAIVDEYVAGQFSFVALRLQVGQDTSAIRPIVLKMTANEACLPLKLTAIAATPDLRINVWVLGDARAVPINYSEITLNQARLDWFNGGRNYDQVLKDAANEAQGNAFAVEYAMPAQTSSTWFTVSSARANLALAVTPPTFLATMQQTGLQLTGAALQFLRRYIPLPATVAARGVTETMFYSNLSAYWSSDMAAFAPFDSVLAAAVLETDILTPMDTYRRLFDRSGKLTRLATFISPEEMMTDPLFVTNASLPDVAPQHMAVAHVLCGDNQFAPCEAPVRLRTEDGHDVNLRASACMQYDRGNLDDQLPAANVAWQRGADGAGQMVVDNRAQITSALKAHNATVATPDTDGGCGCAMGRSPGVMVLVLVTTGALAIRVRRRATSRSRERLS